MRNGRPKLGLSNLYWSRIDKKEREPQPHDEEELEEPIVMDTIEVDMMDRIQVKGYADTFCPPPLTKPKQPVILYASPTKTEKTNG